MKRGLLPTSPCLVATLLALACVSAPTVAGDRLDRSVIGQWQLTSVLGYADATAVDEKEAREMLGKVLIVANDSVQLGERKYGASTFRAEHVGRDRELRETPTYAARRLAFRTG